MGKIGVHICCNDIASAGVKPLGIMVTILAPPSEDINMLSSIMKDIRQTCSELSIDILGGHTEVTDAVNRTILSLTAIGRGRIDEYVTTGGAKIGDDILVTGYAGLEGTGIISKDYYEHLKNRVDEGILHNAQKMIDNISVVKTGLLAAKFGVNAMHDATEGGVLGAIWELAGASNKGVFVEEKLIPVKSETIEICRAVNINPYRLISSGCMIISCKNGEGLSRLLLENGINAAVVGKITEKDMILKTKNGEIPLAAPESDEIYRIQL
jgi:hydrogenase maturation factor